MSKPQESSTPSKAASIAAEAATQAAVAGTAALATGSTPTAAAIQAGAAALPGLITRVTSMVNEWRGKKTRQWLAWTLTSDGAAEVSEEQFASFIEENAEEPWVLETIAESMRALDEMVGDSAIAPLGRLSREYLANKKRPDRFYRGFRRFLADCSSEELLALQELCRFFLANTRDGGEEDSYRISCSEPNKLNLHVEPFKSEETAALYADMARVFRSLRANELADEGASRTTGGAFYQSGPHALQLSRAYAARMAGCLRERRP